MDHSLGSKGKQKTEGSGYRSCPGCLGRLHTLLHFFGPQPSHLPNEGIMCHYAQRSLPALTFEETNLKFVKGVEHRVPKERDRLTK